jgi:hypothetical protein
MLKDLNRRIINDRLNHLDNSIGINTPKRDKVTKVKPSNVKWKKADSYKSRGCLLRTTYNGDLEAI